MGRLARLLQHLTTTTVKGRRVFPTATLDAIKATIAHGEQMHRAEIRLIIEPALPWKAVLNNTQTRTRAIDLFTEHRIWDTEENCGLLLYINLADRRVEVVVDRGVGKLIPADEWRAICCKLTEKFKQGNFHHSVIDALVQVNRLLEQRYPNIGNGPNQLSDSPILL